MTDEVPRRSLKVTDPRALRAYAHPLRMRLIGLLRGEGPMTATQAAARLDDNVPNCSFHLRQLAKYGFAERVPGADGRERPWRATTQYTSWDDDSDDPAMREATDQINSVMVALYLQRAQDYLAIRADEPAEWRAAAGFGDALLHVTAAELGEITGQIDALLARYDERIADPAKRPPGSRPVTFVQMALPRGGVPPHETSRDES
ncbi:helix-turn-helix domain-containing protein [Verrucosispora sp. CWR15]|uniref:Helix-turn-helix domain-containing protein n=1 Tax=Verrucosispora sioxanthis TaxID=2499994 RepID=A0A6M1L4F2_9ACTN|nr:helix-turn-helix domain-containing protein [Verrucosispora sioxanthis]NEE62194.1 helix-turn-helix domain-containing protein [Verrucosispora sioxanthis]NGM11304.1 helix-turn-helix domain-containing protein [Verrucosispora sioxanthis]